MWLWEPVSELTGLLLGRTQMSLGWDQKNGSSRKPQAVQAIPVTVRFGKFWKGAIYCGVSPGCSRQARGCWGVYLP